MASAPPPLINPLPTTDLAPVRHLAGFWRRFFAFVIDGLILGLIGVVLAIPFFDLRSDLGPTGRLVGFFMGLIYFAIPESVAGGSRASASAC